MNSNVTLFLRSIFEAIPDQIQALIILVFISGLVFLLLKSMRD